MPAHKNRSLHIRLRCAWTGLIQALRSERSLQFHVAALALVLVVLFVLRPGAIWWALVILASTGVIAAELFNTALEHLADHLHPEVHPRIRIVKDCAAAAVLVAALGALGIALALLIHLTKR
jgi:undecaprenol kinase